MEWPRGGGNPPAPVVRGAMTVASRWSRLAIGAVVRGTVKFGLERRIVPPAWLQQWCGPMQPGGELLDRARPFSFSASMPSLKLSEPLLEEARAAASRLALHVASGVSIRAYASHVEALLPLIPRNRAVLRRVYHLVVQNERPGLVLGQGVAVGLAVCHAFRHASSRTLPGRPFLGSECETSAA